MIAKLYGTIDELKPTGLILNVNGVGYDLTIPLSTYEKIISLKEVTVYVYTYHREDQFRLFGFFTDKERDLFSNLLGISGIGPAMALSIISGTTVERLVEAVRSENPALLTSIPGVGKAKAEKLIFELKRKIKSIQSYAEGHDEGASLRRDAVEALVSLGFSDSASSSAVDRILKDNPEAALESIVKMALQELS